MRRWLSSDLKLGKNWKLAFDSEFLHCGITVTRKTVDCEVQVYKQGSDDDLREKPMAEK